MWKNHDNKYHACPLMFALAGVQLLYKNAPKASLTFLIGDYAQHKL